MGGVASVIAGVAALFAGFSRPRQSLPINTPYHTPQQEAANKAKEDELRRSLMEKQHEMDKIQEKLQSQRDQASALADQMAQIRIQSAADQNAREAELSRIQALLLQQQQETETARIQKEQNERALQNMQQELAALSARGFTTRPKGWDTMTPDQRKAHSEKLRQDAHDQLGIDTRNCYNFAITGRSGSGKSSLINSIRGLKDNDSRAAKTGETETTGIIKAYPFPDHPHIVLWDLPGAGTEMHPANSYFMDKKLYAFDCIIIVTAGRFTQIDARIGQICREFQTPVIYVRNKSDQSLEAKMYRDGLTEDEAVAQLKAEVEKDARPTLTKYGLADAMLFLISARAFQNPKYRKIDEDEFGIYAKNCAEERRKGGVFNLTHSEHNC